MVPVFVSFSFISGKQIHYLVPLFPAFALFSARLLTRGGQGSIMLPALLVALLGAGMVYFALAGLPGKVGLWADLPWWPGALLAGAALISAWLGWMPHFRLTVLAILGACLFALGQLYISPAAGRSYDMHPMANAIRQLQDRGIPVANIGKYHAQFQFVGRLEHPLAQVNPKELTAWLEKNPQGAVVDYVSSKRAPAGYIFSQPYRGEMVVLLNADQAKGLTDQSGKKRSGLTLPESDEE
jgi:hypothetical protein